MNEQSEEKQLEKLSESNQETNQIKQGTSQI